MSTEPLESLQIPKKCENISRSARFDAPRFCFAHLGLSRIVSGCLGLSRFECSGCLGLSRFVSVCLGLSSMCRAQQFFKIPTFRAARIHCCLLGLFFIRFESLEGVRSVVAVFFDMSCFHWPHFGGPLSVFEVKSRSLGQ